MVQLGDQVVAHVLGVGDEVPGRDEPTVVGEVGRSRPAEPVAIAGGEAVMLGRRRGRERAAHLQGVEDLRLDVALVGAPGDRLHDQPQDCVVDGAVLVGLADRCCQLDAAQLANCLLQRRVTDVAVALERPPGLGRQAARLVQEVADGDLRGSCLVRDSEPGQVALHGGVELDLPGLDELHDGQRGERLG